MKKIAVKIFFCAGILFSQIMNAQEYHHNFEEAQQFAKTNNKQLVLIFSGSDWCKPCIQLKSNILEDPAFVAYADENLVLVEVDFPYKKKNRLSKEQQQHNNQLAERYNPSGSFPMVVLLDETGNRTNQFGYDSKLEVTDYLQKMTRR